MSSSKAYQCLSCQIRTSLSRSVGESRRTLHTSGPRQARQRWSPKRKREATQLQEQLKAYTKEEWDELAKRYTPAQLQAIRSGEQSINVTQMVQEGRFRTDPMRITYLDDFAKSRPLVDFPAAKGDANGAPGAKVTESIEKNQDARSQPREREEEDPHMLRLMQVTGMSKEEIRKLRVKTLFSHRVVNQTRMGKIASQYYLAIAGNENGMVGVGEGKAIENEDATRQAQTNAIRNMKPIPRYEDRTIYGEVQAKVGASIVQLSSRPPGFGNRCQPLIFELTRAAGITDLAARTPRSKNKMNVVKAAFAALTNQRLPEEVAMARGRKMVDVRKVYYGGHVH